MNILIISDRLNNEISELENFLSSKQNPNLIVNLLIMSSKKDQSKYINHNDSSFKKKALIVDYSNAKSLNKVISELFQKFRSISGIIYIESLPEVPAYDFSKLNINNFRSLFLQELNKKITIFQNILPKLKDLPGSKQIIVLVPEKAQTNFIDENISSSMLFSSFHMLTTAIADEFVDYKIFCNGIIQTENYLETVKWVLFENENEMHGCLIKNKKIIDW